MRISSTGSLRLVISYLKSLGKNWQLFGGPRWRDLINVFTVLEELTALPRDSSWIWGRRFAAGRGMGGQEREGKKKREGRAEQGSGRAPETEYSR